MRERIRFIAGRNARPRNNYRRWLYTLVVLLTIIAGLYLSGWIYQVAQAGSDVLGLYFFAWLIQFFFTPAVDRLDRAGLPRVLAVSSVYLALGAATVIILVTTAPAMYTQGERLARELGNPRTYKVISDFTRGAEQFAETRLHIPRNDIQTFTRDYSVRLQNGAFKAGTQLQHLINGRLTASNLSNSATAFLNFLNVLNTLFLNLVIVLILAFYMMLDGHKLVRAALAYFPPAVDEVMEGVHQTINRKFGGYLRGQVILALSYGFLTYIISLGFALSYALLISIVAAVLMLIPFIGAFVSMVPPLLGFVLAHVSDPSFPLLRLVLLFMLLAIVQHIVINVLAPRVMSSVIGMHPLLVMLGLVLGAKLAGLWGAIFGVPVLGVILDTVDLIYRRVMERRYGFHPRHIEDFDDIYPPRPRPPSRRSNGVVMMVRRRVPLNVRPMRRR